MKEIKRGDIFYADLNPVRGSEQGGIRPVICIQNDTGNRFSPTVIIAPITSSLDKLKLPTHIMVCGDGLTKASIVLLEQIRTIDKCRIAEYIGKLDSANMKRVDKAIAVSFGIGYLEGLRNG